MKAILDTSAYSGLMRGDEEILSLLAAASVVLVPTVVLGELLSGFRRGSRQSQNESQLQAFLAKPSVGVIDVTAATAGRYADVDFYLFSQGLPIPRNDVWIAALTLEHGATLITRDAHFRQLPLLPVRP